MYSFKKIDAKCAVNRSKQGVEKDGQDGCCSRRDSKKRRKLLCEKREDVYVSAELNRRVRVAVRLTCGILCHVERERDERMSSCVQEGETKCDQLNFNKRENYACLALVVQCASFVFGLRKTDNLIICVP
jgi:hypothetical protein